MTKFRVYKDHPDWAIFPDRPWSVLELLDDGEWWKRGNYPTWPQALDRVRELAVGASL